MINRRVLETEARMMLIKWEGMYPDRCDERAKDIADSLEEAYKRGASDKVHGKRLEDLDTVLKSNAEIDPAIRDLLSGLPQGVRWVFVTWPNDCGPLSFANPAGTDRIRWTVGGSEPGWMTTAFFVEVLGMARRYKEGWTPLPEAARQARGTLALFCGVDVGRLADQADDLFPRVRKLMPPGSLYGIFVGPSSIPFTTNHCLHHGEAQSPRGMLQALTVALAAKEMDPG